MKRGSLEEKVIEHFEASSEIYSGRKGAISDIDLDLIKCFKNAKVKPQKILEVGGGSGYLLDQVGLINEDVQLVNCEISYRTYKEQANSEINLIGGNAVWLPFADDTFEYVIAKNLFHHIVGVTRKISKNYAKTAAEEMKRVLKSGGYLLIVEEYHQYRPFASLIFYASLLFSLGNITWNYFYIRPKVIVSFLTPYEIRRLFNPKNTEQGSIEFEKLYPIKHNNLFMKVFPFFLKMGFMLHVRRFGSSDNENR